MSWLVTALYDGREEANNAVNILRAKMPFIDAEVYDSSPSSIEALESLELTADERKACGSKLASGEFLLLAQVISSDETDRVIALLEGVAEDQPLHSNSPTSQAEPRERNESSVIIEEQRLPIVEEELRVGTREVVRGGARVSTQVEALPVVQDIELLEEFVRIYQRPGHRHITEEELEQAGLFRERVIEIAQVREEAVIKKEAFVREEVVITKTIQQRVEQVHETLRRTEVEIEDFGRASVPDKEVGQGT